jgi:hypothetical protein
VLQLVKLTPTSRLRLPKVRLEGEELVLVNGTRKWRASDAEISILDGLVAHLLEQLLGTISRARECRRRRDEGQVWILGRCGGHGGWIGTEKEEDEKKNSK